VYLLPYPIPTPVKYMSAVPRDQAGSATLATRRHPSAESPDQAVAACGGNLQLLEARVVALTTSIRALHRSNAALAEVVAESHARGEAPDPDFVEAIQENRGAIRRQALTCAALVQAMQAQGARVDVEADIREAVRTIELEEAAEATVSQAGATETSEEGLYL
jgi:hypothetical protein